MTFKNIDLIVKKRLNNIEEQKIVLTPEIPAIKGYCKKINLKEHFNKIKDIIS